MMEEVRAGRSSSPPLRVLQSWNALAQRLRTEPPAIIIPLTIALLAALSRVTVCSSLTLRDTIYCLSAPFAAALSINTTPPSTTRGARDLSPRSPTFPTTPTAPCLWQSSQKKLLHPRSPCCACRRHKASAPTCRRLAACQLLGEVYHQAH